jgi:hypothetical protein
MESQRSLRLFAATLAAGLLGCLGPPPSDFSDAAGDDTGGDDAAGDSATGNDGARDGTVPQDSGGFQDGSFDSTRSLDAADAGTSPDGNPDAQDTGAPPDAATCTSGNACSPAPCQLGATTCDGGTVQCTPTTSLMNGAVCDAGAVCNAGVCGACGSGTDCTEAGSCQKMIIACSSGSPVCAPAGTVSNGTLCGANLYCNAGSCAPCTAGGTCPPPLKPCNQGVVSCSQGQVVCTDQGTPAPNGTSCGTNQVCNAGQCGACSANVQCTPTNACHTGLTSCASGAQVCVDTGNPQVNGTGCTGADLCNKTYTCMGGMCTGSNPITCSAMDQCHSVGTCDMTTGKCSNPVATGATCDDGNPCTQTDTCQSDAGCLGSNPKSCPAIDLCHLVGTCNTSTGACSTPFASSGTSCGTNQICDGNGNCGCAAAYPNSCSGACVNLTSDQNNCGSCGHPCLGGSCLSGQCQPVTLGGDSTANDVTAIALDSTNIYWAQLANMGTIVKCPIATGCSGGAQPVTTGGLGGNYTFSLAVDSTNIYWAQSNNMVMKCALSGCSTGTTFFAPSQVGYTRTPVKVGVDATNVYWYEADTSGTVRMDYIYSCPVAGCPGGVNGTPNLVAQLPAKPDYFTVGPGFVYTGVRYALGDGGTGSQILKCSILGCSNTPTVLVSTGAVNTGGSLGPFAADSANVYWTDQGNGVFQCSANGCSTPTVLSPTNGEYVVVDSTNVYFGVGGNVDKCAIGGCGQSPIALAQGLSQPLVFGVDSSAVYFTVSVGISFLKLAK